MSPSLPRTRTLHEVSVPSFFYGTAWKEQRTAELTGLALDAGFRAIDTANQRKHYHEAGVGEAIAARYEDGTLNRSDLFLQTKFTHTDGQDHRLPYRADAPIAEQVEQSFASSLEHLRTPHIDSYVLHGPSLRDRLSDEDWQVWQAMALLKLKGKVRLLGVSNVTLGHLEALFASDEAKPAFVQNRCYARTRWDRGVRDFCRAHDVAYQGFSLLTANRRELSAPAVAKIVTRTGRTLEQVVFRFALGVGMIPLTGTSDAKHMRQDLESFDFELTADDINTIEQIA